MRAVVEQSRYAIFSSSAVALITERAKSDSSASSFCRIPMKFCSTGHRETHARTHTERERQTDRVTE